VLESQLQPMPHGAVADYLDPLLDFVVLPDDTDFGCDAIFEGPLGEARPHQGCSASQAAKASA
jgi:hypothetical protein